MRVISSPQFHLPKTGEIRRAGQAVDPAKAINHAQKIKRLEPTAFLLGLLDAFILQNVLDERKVAFLGHGMANVASENAPISVFQFFCSIADPISSSALNPKTWLSR
jgi:hypothetical protein